MNHLILEKLGRSILFANGQATSVTAKQNATAAVVNIATGLTYKSMSDLLTTITHGNGLVTNAGYDFDYRLTSLQLKNGAAVVQGKTYGNGVGMNLTAITDTVAVAPSNWLTSCPM